MLGIIFGALGILLGGPFAKAALDAYRARLSAENASEKIAADLAARELAVEQREGELASQSVLAEQGLPDLCSPSLSSSMCGKWWFGTRFSPSARPIHFRATSHTGRPLCSLHISAAVRLRKLHVFSRASDAAWL